MNEFQMYVAIVTSVLMFVASFITSTENIGSTLIFKVVPFSLGMCNFIVAGRLLGWF